MAAKLKFNMAGWNELAKTVIETEGVARMKRVADACNAELASGRDASKSDSGEGGADSDVDPEGGYRVSVEGDKALEKRDYRATVITATPDAMRNNAKHNTLVNNLYRAGDE